MTWLKRYLRYLLVNHPNFFTESSFGIYLHVLLEKTQIQPPGEPQEQHLHSK